MQINLNYQKDFKVQLFQILLFQLIFTADLTITNLLIYTEGNIYLNAWTKFPLNNRQPSKLITISDHPLTLTESKTITSVSIENLYRNPAVPPSPSLFSLEECSAEECLWQSKSFTLKTGKNQILYFTFVKYILYLSEIVKTWPLGFCLCRLQASAVSKNVGGLASWSAQADKLRDCPNSGWVVQAWGAKLVG